MKKSVFLGVLFGVLGMMALLLQTVIHPLTANGIPAVLQNFTPSMISSLLFYMALFCVCEIGSSFLNSFSTIIQEMLIGRSVARKMQSAMQRILYTDDTYLKNDPEAIINTVSADIETISSYRVSMLLELPLIVVGLVLSLLMMYFGSLPCLSAFGFESMQKGNPFLATLVLALSPLQLAFLLYNRKLCSCEQIRQSASNNVVQKSTESLRGLMDVRSANAFPFAFARIGDACRSFYHARTKMFSLITMLNSVSGLVWAFSQIVLLSVCSWLIFHRTNDFSYPDYVGFTALAIVFNAYVGRAFHCVMRRQTASPAMKRMTKVMQLRNAFGDSSGIRLKPGRHVLSLRHVSYEPEPGIEILSDINLSVAPGEHLSLVGPSGCGKSTLLKLTMRHLAPTKGAVCLDDHPIEELDFAFYAGTVAYVSQRPFIFNGTIRDNILVGRNDRITRERLHEILDEVVLSDDLRKKNPDIDLALDFELHAGGQELSGGQMAKVALARALALDPEILLLDEVTAPLDELSQRKIIHLLETKYRSKTIVSISHRLPAVRNADRIVVMDSGRIVQVGTFETLSRESGLFAALLARDVPSTRNSVINLALGEDKRGIIQTLSLCPLFASVPGPLLESLATRTTQANFRAGSHIVRKGEAGDSLFVLQSGAIEIAGQKYGAGASFGEIAVFYGGIRTADVVALTDCATINLSRDTLLDAIAQQPKLAELLLTETARIAARESAVYEPSDWRPTDTCRG